MLLVWTLVLAVAAPPALSVRAAIDEALAHSPELRLAEAARARAEGERQGASALFPSDASLGASFATAQPFASAERALDVSLSQEIEIAGQRGLRKGSAEAEMRAAEARLSATRQALAARAWGAFGQAWQATARAQLAASLQEGNRALVEVAERRVRAGDLSPLAANVVRIEAARSEARLAQAQAQERRARAELGRVLGRTSAVTEGLEEPVARGEGTEGEEQWVARAIANRRDLQAIRDTIEARRQREALARRSWVPNPTVQLGLMHDVQSFDRDDFKGDPAVAGNLSASASDTFLALGLAVPLPSPARRNGEIRAASAEVLEAQAQLSLAEQAIAADVRGALAQMTEAQRSLEVLGRIAQQASDNVELSRRGFEAGELDLATFLAARTSSFESQGELIDARAGVLAARAALAAAAGETP